MFSTLLVVLPVFALILAGWGGRRSGVFGPAASGELNRFVVYLALPALLFDIVATADWATAWRPDFVAVFGISALAIFALAAGLALWRGRGLANAAVEGLNAGYGNTAYMGFPLGLAAFGTGTLPLTLLTSIITVCALFALGVVLIEVGLQQETHPGRAALKVAGSLARNPLVLAPVLGAAVPLFGLAVPAPAESVLKLLGGAAAPCALVALGLFLGDARIGGRATLRAAAGLVALKLLALPLLAWVLATQVFHLPPLLAHTAILAAALPTGTGPFMLAEHYRREAALTATVVLVSTVLSLVTVTAYLMSLR